MVGLFVLSLIVAQQPVTRADAEAAALARGSRAAFGRADTAAAAAALHGARLFPNPVLSATYSKDTPHSHLIAELPLDVPWLRAPRIGAASGSLDAARFGFAFERASIRFDVDTTYTHALAASQHARVSRRNADDADSLLAMARLRHSVGDVSELEVRLAEVNAGQLENLAADDSLGALEAVLAVQLAMGLPAAEPTIALVDSLAPPPDSLTPAAGEPLPVAAAGASFRAQQRSLTFAHRNVLPTPSFTAGIEYGDPTGTGGNLPTFGIAFSFPLFNWNGGEIGQARAGLDRAQAELDLTRRETAANQASARRRFAAAHARLERDRRLLGGADRVAAMALRAYAEGAVALPSVLEAQRTSREALSRYIDDVAAALDATAAVRLAGATVEP